MVNGRLVDMMIIMVLLSDDVVLLNLWVDVV